MDLVIVLGMGEMINGRTPNSIVSMARWVSVSAIFVMPLGLFLRCNESMSFEKEYTMAFVSGYVSTSLCKLCVLKSVSLWAR